MLLTDKSPSIIEAESPANEWIRPKILILPPIVIFFFIPTPPSIITLPLLTPVVFELFNICKYPGVVILCVLILNVFEVKLTECNEFISIISSERNKPFFVEYKVNSLDENTLNGLSDTILRSFSSALENEISPSILIAWLSLPFIVDNIFTWVKYDTPGSINPILVESICELVISASLIWVLLPVGFISMSTFLNLISESKKNF